jgi:hypothetical protein
MHQSGHTIAYHWHEVEDHGEMPIADVKSVDISDHLVLEDGEVEQPRSSGRKRS